MMTLLVRPFANFYRSYPRPYWFLVMGMLLNGAGTFVLPFETLYLVVQRHLPISQASSIVACYGAGSCVSALCGGLLADKLGRRPTMLLGLFCLAATTFLLAFAQAPWLLALLTFGVGWWISLYSPASNAVVADLLPAADQARANGLIYWVFNVGMALSPVLASLIVVHGGYVFLFCADGTATLCFGLLVFLGMPETRPAVAAVPAQPTRARRKRAHRSLSLLRDLPFLVFLLLMFGLSCIYFQNQSTLPADMQVHGISAAQYGLAIAVNGLVVVLLGLPVSHLLTCWSPLRALTVAALLVGGGFGLMVLAGKPASLLLYVISIVVWTLGEIIFVPASAAVVAELAPIHSRGLYQGMARLSWGLSACAGPLVGGFVLARFGSLVWIGCATLGIAVAGGFHLIERCRVFQYPESSNENLLLVALTSTESKQCQGSEQLPVAREIDQERDDCTIRATA